jgi:hypothetical protein
MDFDEMVFQALERNTAKGRAIKRG